MSIPKQHGDKLNVYQSIILTLISYPILILFGGIILIYRNVINILLKIKHGEKYGGLLPTSDSLFCLNDISPPNILGLLILKSDRKLDMLNLTRKALRTKIFYSPNDYAKLTGTKHTLSGYPYLIKNSCKLVECVRSLELPKTDNSVLNEAYLKEIMGTIITKPFPHNDTGLWEFIIGETPLKGDYNDKYYRYPIITRFRHAVGNGISLTLLLMKIFGDGEADVYGDKLFGRMTVQNDTYFDAPNLRWNKLKEVFKSTICILFMGVGRCLQFHKLNPKIRFHPAPCGQKVVAWNVENSVTFLPMVKNIKNRVPDAKFSDVILTAISGSLSTFFNRNFQQIPDSIPAMLPIVLDFPKLHRSKPVRLENKTTAGVIQLPVNKMKSQLETLKNISEKRKELRNDDIIVISYFVKCVGFFPICIIQKALSNGSQTSLISNIPGCSQVQGTEGYSVEKIIPLAPNTYGGAISFTLITYDERLQLGILVDKAIVPSQEKAQKIVDDVFQNLKLLDAETKNIYCVK